MNFNEKRDPLPVFSRFLKNQLGENLNANSSTFVEMLAGDAAIEFPYTPPGGVARVEGRDAIEKYLDSVAGLLIIHRIDVVSQHQDGGVFFLEFTCQGEATETGHPYNQTYISVITLRDGFIAHYKDYWNPLVVLEATGGQEAIEKALKGGVS